MAKIIVIIVGILISLIGGIPVISSSLKALNIPQAKEKGLKRAGRYIGILERFIVFLLIMSNHYAGIGLIFAAKSIARFEELKRREFAEYYLIGTLMSISWAMLWGWITKLCLS